MKQETINTEFNTYFHLLTLEQKSSVLSLIKSFIKTDKRISLKQYNKELLAAEKRIDSGKFITQEDVEKEIEKW